MIVKLIFFTTHGYRTVRYNQYGRGLSGYLKGDYTHREYIETAIELFNSLGLDSIILVGHSFGAGVAAMIEVEIPERISKIVLLDPSLDEVTGNVGADIERLPIIGELVGKLIMPNVLQKRAHSLLAEAGVSESDSVYFVLNRQRRTKGQCCSA